jgi:hypothetical protein
MRYRIKEYTIGGDTDFFVSGKIGVEDIRLIINETQKKVICSSMNKSNVACEYVEDMDATFISFSSSICILQPSDKLTIEVDKGDTLTQVASKVEEVGNKIDNIDLTPIENKVDEGVSTLSDKIDNIDLSAVENKVQEESAAIQGKIDNIKLPEIDTAELAKETTLNAVLNKLDNLNVDVDLSSMAKQGDNNEATNSKILEEVQKIPNLKNIYSARFEKNDDNINTYTMILPIIAGVEGDTIIL